MIVPLGFVAVEDLLTRESSEHGGELPSEIERIADGAVVSLALPHRHDVGRVAGEEHPALTEALCDPGMVGVDAATDDLNRVRIDDEGGEQPADEGGILGVLLPPRP